MDEGARSIVEMAEHDTSVHLHYLKDSIVRGLMFTIVIILMDILSVAAATVSGKTAEYLYDFLKLTPNPILLVALLISAVIQFYLLRKIGSCYAEIKRIRKHSDDADEKRKSITDINYEIIGAVNKSMKVWPIIAALFILYFIGCTSMLIEFVLGIGPNMVLDASTALNLSTIIISAYFFVTQTSLWLVQRRRMRELENMERTVAEELHI